MKHLILIFTIMAISSAMAEPKLQPPCDGADGTYHPNGGGFVADTAMVSPSAYIGENAQICENVRVLCNARVDGFVKLGDAEVSEYESLLHNRSYSTLGLGHNFSGEIKHPGNAEVSEYKTIPHNRFYSTLGLGHNFSGEIKHPGNAEVSEYKTIPHWDGDAEVSEYEKAMARVMAHVFASAITLGHNFSGNVEHEKCN